MARKRSARRVEIDSGRSLLFAGTDFAKAIASAVEQLQAAQRALLSAACPNIDDALRINLRDLSAERINEVLRAVPAGHCKAEKGVDYIYVIEVSEQQAQLVATLRSRLIEARKTANDYPRVNGGNEATTTLYVGRSKTLRSRLRQHLGAGSRGVYALHLQRWATGNDAEIAISAMKFDGAEDLLVQAVEDGLWASLKPAFGRKGEK